MKLFGAMLGLAVALVGGAASAQPSVMLNGELASGIGAARIPWSGVTVNVFQAGAGGARPLGQAQADAEGRFRVRIAPDPDGGVIYATARSGGQVEFMALIGEQVPDKVSINELSTVASAYALARVFQGDLAIPARPRLPAEVAAGLAHDLVDIRTGRPSAVMLASPNADETNARRLLGTLANLMATCVRGSEKGCNQLFKLTTSADGGRPATSLEAMVSIARHPAANLRELFDLAQAYDISGPALDPLRQGPDAANEQMRLDAFTLAIKFNATGRTDAEGKEVCPFGGPANVAFDLNGDLWITNNVVQGETGSAFCMVVLKPDGTPESFSPVTGGGVVGQGFGLGFAPDGTVWSGNFGWGGVDPTDEQGDPGGSVSHFTRTGQPLSPDWGFTSNLDKVQGTVSDAQGNIWMASFGNNRVQVFPLGDAATAMPAYADDNSLPFDIRLDRQGDAWVSYNATATLTKFTLTASGPQPLFSIQAGSTPGAAPAPVHITGGPKGLAVNGRGEVWVAHGNDNAVYAFAADGTALGSFSGGGVDGPWGVSLDSASMLWVANFGPLGPWERKPRITELCGAKACAGGLKRGDPASPSTGWTLPSGGDEVRLHNGDPLYFPLKAKSFKPLQRVTSVNVDAAGNVWAANNWKPSWVIDVAKNPGGDAMVVFVGLATPTQPVLYSTPAISPFAQ